MNNALLQQTREKHRKDKEACKQMENNTHHTADATQREKHVLFISDVNADASRRH